MAVYFITGKLGSGKTLSAVGRIREYLAQGRPVATNLDLNLVQLCGPKAKTPVVYRLPDKPSVDDFETIGIGNTSYDESRNGLIVLDECGTWFNSRTWGDKERQLIINWFLHARKKGWDIIFIVQSIQIVDKQARLTLAEHVVYCRRMDKLSIPLISPLVKALTGIRLTMPQIHFAVVKYGDQEHSLTVDRWWYLGHDLYSAYDTKQAFSDFYPHSTYQLLSPWLSRGRYMLPLTWSRAMRITKIHWKRFSRPVIAGAFFAAGVALAMLQQPEPVVEQQPVVEQPAQEQPQASLVSTITQGKDDAPVSTTPVRDQYQQWRITGYMKLGSRTAYTLADPEGKTVSLDALASMGLDVIIRDNCSVRILSATAPDDYADVYARACVSDDLRPVVTDAIAVLDRSVSPSSLQVLSTGDEGLPLSADAPQYVPDMARFRRAQQEQLRTAGPDIVRVGGGKPGHLW